MKFSQNKMVFNICIQVRVLDSVCFHSTTLHVDQTHLVANIIYCNTIDVNYINTYYVDNGDLFSLHDIFYLLEGK